MQLAVYNFNKPRNGFKWDAANEQKMLQEEIKEFADATTVAERLDALIDTMYVWEGTKMKALFNSEVLSETFRNGVESAIQMMYEIVKQELNASYDVFPEIIRRATKIVCDANALKPYKLDEKGKVKKGADTPNATKQIEEMIRQYQAQ